jgi:hypothetical protein
MGGDAVAVRVTDGLRVLGGLRVPDCVSAALAVKEPVAALDSEPVALVDGAPVCEPVALVDGAPVVDDVGDCVALALGVPVALEDPALVGLGVLDCCATERS